MNVVWHVSETVAFGDRFCVYDKCHCDLIREKQSPGNESTSYAFQAINPASH